MTYILHHFSFDLFFCFVYDLFPSPKLFFDSLQAETGIEKKLAEETSVLDRRSRRPPSSHTSSTLLKPSNLTNHPNLHYCLSCHYSTHSITMTILHIA